MTRNHDWLCRPANDLQILPTGDVAIREPQEGWSRAFYEAVVRQYLAVRGTCPCTARMHPSTALAVTPTEGVLPERWSVYEVRCHYAPTRIILSDEPPQVFAP
jgi:hypothetical protein